MQKMTQVLNFYKAVFSEVRRHRVVLFMSTLWLVISAFSTYLTYSDKLSDTPITFSPSFRQAYSRILPYIFVLLVLYLLLLILFAAYRYHTRTVADLRAGHESVVSGLKARVEELASESVRPRFGLRNPKIYEKSEDNRHYFDVGLENVGSQTASDLVARVIIVEENLNGKPFETDDSVAVEIAVNECVNTELFIGRLSDNEPPHYIILGFKYKDVVTKKPYKQLLFMKWKGMKNGAITRDFVYLTIEEQQKVMERLGKLLMDFVPDEGDVDKRKMRTRQ